MLKQILVTYDLNAAGQNYAKLVDAIRSLGNCKRILQSVWVLKTDLDCNTVRNRLKTVIDANDFIFVCEFDRWSSFMAEESNAFLLGRSAAG